MKHIFLLAALTLAATSGHAGGYLGINFGQSKIDGEVSSPFSVNIHDTSNASKLFAGYEFNPYFGVEFGYLSPSTFTVTESSGADRMETKLKTRAYFADFVVQYPVTERWTAMGKLGAARMKITINESGTAGFSGCCVDDQFTDTAKRYGLGLKYAMSNDFALRLELERTANIGRADDTESDIDTASVGVTYRF